MKKYTVSIHGYGSEITIGSVTAEEKAILLNEDKDLVEIVQEDLDEYGAYYEIDDQYHRWGATDHFTITIEDEDGNTVFEVNDEDIHDHDTEDFELVEYIDIYSQINQDLDLLITDAAELRRRDTERASERSMVESIPEVAGPSERDRAFSYNGHIQAYGRIGRMGARRREEIQAYSGKHDLCSRAAAKEHVPIHVRGRPFRRIQAEHLYRIFLGQRKIRIPYEERLGSRATGVV